MVPIYPSQWGTSQWLYRQRIPRRGSLELRQGAAENWHEQYTGPRTSGKYPQAMNLSYDVVEADFDSLVLARSQARRSKVPYTGR